MIQDNTISIKTCSGGDKSGNASSFKEVLAITLLAAAVLLPFLGQNYNWASREIRHAEIMREMAASGDFVVPRLLGTVYIDKPPVMHVIGAAFMRMSGSPSLFHARLPSALAAILGVLATYSLGRLFLDRKGAFLAGLCLLAFPGFMMTARLARPDMVFAVLILLSALGLGWGMRFQPGTKRWVCFGLAGAASGLAVIAKGPYGLLFPLLVPLFAPMQKQELRQPRWGFLLFGVVLAMTLASWAIPVYLRDGGNYLSAVLHQRDLTTGASTHAEAFYWYLGPIFLLTLPLCLFLPFVVQKWRREGISACLAITCVMLLVLSCVPGKRNHYLTPLYPFMAVAIAEGIGYCQWRAQQVKKAAFILIALSIAGGVLAYGLIFPLTRPKGDPNYIFASQVAKAVPPGATILCADNAEDIAWARLDHTNIIYLSQTDSLADKLKSYGRGTYLVAAKSDYQRLSGDASLHALRLLLEVKGERKNAWVLCRFGD